MISVTLAFLRKGFGIQRSNEVVGVLTLTLLAVFIRSKALLRPFLERDLGIQRSNEVVGVLTPSLCIISLFRQTRRVLVRYAKSMKQQLALCKLSKLKRIRVFVLALAISQPILPSFLIVKRLPTASLEGLGRQHKPILPTDR